MVCRRLQKNISSHVRNSGNTSKKRHEKRGVSANKLVVELTMEALERREWPRTESGNIAVGKRVAPLPPPMIRTCPLRHPAPPSGLAPALGINGNWVDPATDVWFFQLGARQSRSVVLLMPTQANQSFCDLRRIMSSHTRFSAKEEAV